MFSPPSSNALFLTLMFLLTYDYDIMERWSHGIAYYHMHTHTHIQIATNFATGLVQIRKFNFPCFGSLVCFDLLRPIMTQIFAAELNWRVKLNISSVFQKNCNHSSDFIILLKNIWPFPLSFPPPDFVFPPLVTSLSFHFLYSRLLFPSCSQLCFSYISTIWLWGL